MAKVEQHAPGMFSWADLSTTDVDAAKRFYGALFGWEYDDQAAGENATYSMALVEGRTVAGLFAQRDAEKEMGLAAHWTSYFTVQNVDQKADKLRELGGQLIAPPFDVFEAGRMCAFSDPSGAIAALWQPKLHIGAMLMGEHGTLGWTELLTRDPEAAREFHRALHEFSVDSMPMPSGAYTIFKVDQRPSCGLMPMPPTVPAQVPSHWLVYFNVYEIEASLEKARANGGQVLSPIHSVPNVGRFATLRDPQGATFAAIQPSQV